jgi:hypothetical protein
MSILRFILLKERISKLNPINEISSYVINLKDFDYIYNDTSQKLTSLARELNGFKRHENFMGDTQKALTLFQSLESKLLKYKEGYEKKDFQSYYIPILRGLRPIQSHNEENGKLVFDCKKDNYKERTISDYWEMPRYQNNVFTGLNLYEDIQSKLLDKREDRKLVRDFEEFIQSKFFPDKTVTLIPKVGADSLLIGVGNDDEQMVYNLGDGIQALIVMLYPIFMRKGENALFFIEEPELSLHPGMQRVFLETLLSEEFSTMQFFFTTHSNHFLDITMDTKSVSVYGFKIKDGDFKINVLEGGDQNILKDLGVLNSSVFLSNCTIWVEGITDRKYLRHFMSLYISKEKPNNKFLEDLHYSFVEYAGSNITHWDFEGEENSEAINALRINQNIFLIVDSDIKGGKKVDAKIKRHEKLREILNDNFYITEGKEIENMLSYSTIQAVISEYEGKPFNELDFKTKLEKVTDPIQSNNNDSLIEKPIYWDKNVGEVIDKGLGEARKHNYVNILVNSKNIFCDKAIKNIKSYDDLSDEAKKLCAKIYEFISRHNK